MEQETTRKEFLELKLDHLRRELRQTSGSIGRDEIRAQIAEVERELENSQTD